MLLLLIRQILSIRLLRGRLCLLTVGLRLLRLLSLYTRRIWGVLLLSLSSFLSLRRTLLKLLKLRLIRCILSILGLLSLMLFLRCLLRRDHLWTHPRLLPL